MDLLRASLVVSFLATAGAYTCKFSHDLFQDPIMYPGSGKTTLHNEFFGNVGTNGTTLSASDLLEHSSTCEAKNDRSAYYAPKLFVVREDNDDYPEDVEALYAYVSFKKQKNDADVPQGLKLIIGDPFAYTDRCEDDSRKIGWKCTNSNDTHIYGDFPDCHGPGELLVLAATFPSCWNGKDLDSVDHNSHVWYAYENGTCPLCHNVSIPELHLEVVYNTSVPPNDTIGVATLPSGPYSAYSGFFAAYLASSFFEPSPPPPPRSPPPRSPPPRSPPPRSPPPYADTRPPAPAPSRTPSPGSPRVPSPGSQRPPSPGSSKAPSPSETPPNKPDVKHYECCKCTCET